MRPPCDPGAHQQPWAPCDPHAHQPWAPRNHRLVGGGFFVVSCLFIPILYCAVCTYFAMFAMKLCEGMTLHPHQHSDGSSLLFNATYACRLGPAICFNYLKLLHAPKGLYHRPHGTLVPTYFSQVKGESEGAGEGWG